jgi:hypothetical protein
MTATFRRRNALRSHPSLAENPRSGPRETNQEPRKGEHSEKRISLSEGAPREKEAKPKNEGLFFVFCSLFQSSFVRFVRARGRKATEFRFLLIRIFLPCRGHRFSARCPKLLRACSRPHRDAPLAVIADGGETRQQQQQQQRRFRRRRRHQRRRLAFARHHQRRLRRLQGPSLLLSMHVSHEQKAARTLLSPR